MNNDIEEIFKHLDTKHLPVVDRMVIDINKRMLREKSLSLQNFNQNKPKNSQKSERKKVKADKVKVSEEKSQNHYTFLGEFYSRLQQDIEKRKVKTKIRQQIKKILDKKKEGVQRSRTFSPMKPHLPHRFANEQIEIEKIYGEPGKPI